MSADRETSPSTVCTNCVLPATFPGIRFNNEGICNFCLDFKGINDLDRRKAEYRERFNKLVEKYKGTGTYDALMCYSGGKDSTYTLTILKEKYDLNILALSFDNGFISDQASRNIRNVVERIGIDHIFFKVRIDILARIFRSCVDNDIYPIKAMERASGICTSCMGIIKYTALRFALEKGIPFIAFGWSPGQAPITSSVMKNNPQMTKMMQKTIYDPLYQITGSEIKPYFLEDKHFSDLYNFPYNIHPLAFLDYDEEAIYRTITSLGWKAPEDVDANSTNCLLNSFANVVHKQRFGFHPYAFELANLVREGYLDRNIALERINQQEDPQTVAQVKKKLSAI